MTNSPHDDSGSKYPRYLNRNIHLSSLVIFDIETTGGNPEKNGITEIFALRWQKGKVIETFYSMVNPQIPIPPIVRRMTGITNQMVRHEPLIGEVMPKFLEFLRDDILVSHNTIGDLKFLRYFAKTACNVDYEPFFLCTHLLSEKLLSEAPDKSLGGLASYLGVKDLGDHHRAEADGYMTLELFKALQKRMYERNIRDVVDGIRLQADVESGMRIGWRIPSTKIRRLPKSPGVLKLLDEHGKILFLTGCRNLRREALHLQDFSKLPRALLRLCFQAKEVDYIQTKHWVEAILLEATLVSKQELRFKPLQWHKRTIPCLNLSYEGDQIRAALSPVTSASFTVFGPIIERGRALEDLSALASVLGVKASNKKGLAVPLAKAALVQSFFMGTLRDFDWRRRFLSRISLKFLLSPLFRREIASDIEDLHHLLLEGRTRKYPSIVSANGVITAPLDAKGDRWHLYPVRGLMASEPLTIEGSWQEWLKTRDGRRFIRTLHRKPSNVLRTIEQSDILNATAWLVTSGSKRFSAHRYWSAQELNYI